MRWFGWILFALAIVYIGNVLGCMILCEIIPQIKTVRKYAWKIPIFNFALLFCFLLEILDGWEGFMSFWGFIRLPHKNILVMHAIAQLLEKRNIEECEDCRLNRSESQKKRAAVLKGTFESLAAATTRIL